MERLSILIQLSQMSRNTVRRTTHCLSRQRLFRSFHLGEAFEKDDAETREGCPVRTSRTAPMALAEGRQLVEDIAHARCRAIPSVYTWMR